MAYYKSPYQPIDPINPEPEHQITGASRYLRENFHGTGQDSYTDPTSQDQSMWQKLTNAMPIASGSLRRRRGANFFRTLATGPYTRSAIYQSDLSGFRGEIYSSAGVVRVLDETGTLYRNNIFLPAASATMVPRTVMSRSFAYFLDGEPTDLKKWDGSVTGGVTNWGIDATAINGGSAGPTAPTVAANANKTGLTWTNPNNIKTNDGVYATVDLTPGQESDYLQGSTFGFAVAGTIIGIKVELEIKTDPSGGGIGHVILSKGGTFYGNTRVTGFSGTASTFYTFGGPTDLWGGTWTTADINAANFMASFTAATLFGGSTTRTISVDFMRVTIYTDTNQVAVGVAVAGAVNLTVGRIYYLVANNSSTGHYSDLNIASGTTGPATNKKFPLTLPVYTDSQVDFKTLLATADGGDPSELFVVASIANATTTYTDNTTEDTLVLNQPLLFTDDFGNDFGVAGNTPPQSGTVCIKHKGRLWMAVDQNLFFSKSTSDLTLPNGFIAGKYEECWPGDSYFDISEGAEQIQGLQSDGDVLYIGTQSHIRRLFGDDPSNFQEPEIAHPQVGVVNQEVWQIVYLEGNPSGMLWLTPDKKVIASDGNSYFDVGHPIQDVLNSINTDAIANSHAMYAGSGEYDNYILAVPTGDNTYCDTHLVYDLRAKQWSVWIPPDLSTTLLYNIASTGVPQWWFMTTTADLTTPTLYQYDPTITEDNVDGVTSVPIATVFQTSWLHFGAATFRKLLDEMEIIGDPALTITIEGANIQADFTTPKTVIADAPLKTDPFGVFKLFLATTTTKYRYYRFTFKSSSDEPNILESYNIRFMPYNSL